MGLKGGWLSFPLSDALPFMVSLSSLLSAPKISLLFLLKILSTASIINLFK